MKCSHFGGEIASSSLRTQTSFRLPLVSAENDNNDNNDTDNNEYLNFEFSAIVVTIFRILENFNMQYPHVQGRGLAS